VGRIIEIQAINNEQNFYQFDCIEATLNEWLQKRALKNEGESSRTFVILDSNESKNVIAYFCLSTGSVERSASSTKIKRNMPNPIPVCVLGRLAVDKNYQGKGIGSYMLQQSILKTIAVSKQIGVRALLVHVLTRQAKGFYLQYGFHISPTNDMTLMLSIKEAIAAIGINEE